MFYIYFIYMRYKMTEAKYSMMLIKDIQSSKNPEATISTNGNINCTMLIDTGSYLNGNKAIEEGYTDSYKTKNNPIDKKYEKIAQN